MESNKRNFEENFEESKQRIIEFVDGVSKEEIKKWEESKRYKGWHFYYTMDICLLVLASFNFKMSEDDLIKAVETVGLRFRRKISLAISLWEGTLRGKSYGWQTCSSLDIYINSRFLEWPRVKDYLKFLTEKNDYSRDMFIMCKLNPDILEQTFHLAWWMGKELEKIEKSK